MVSKLRSQRIADRIREDLSEILLQEVSDPRLVAFRSQMLRWIVSWRFADMYVSALEGSSAGSRDPRRVGTCPGLFAAQFAQRIDLRVFPHLRFHWDPDL